MIILSCWLLKENRIGNNNLFAESGEMEMPYITVESGKLSDEQKELLIKRLTEVSSEIMNVPQEFFVTTIKEVPDKNFGIGGKTIDRVKEEYIRERQQST